MYWRKKTFSQGEHHTNKMKQIFIIMFSLFLKFAFTQDVHYSQFDKTRSLLNPSLISKQKDDYELMLQRRSQWSSVTAPFKTLSLSFTTKNFYKNISLGGTILNDIAGDSRFSTNGISLSLAPSFVFKASTIGIGLQAGLYQRALNYNNLIFLENEYLKTMKFSFFDFSCGIFNYRKIDQKSALTVGASLFHLNRPKQSLINNDQVFLNSKFVFHTTYSNIINPQISLAPTLYFSLQGTDKEFVFGCGSTYKLNNNVNLKSGIYTRINDAFFLTLGIDKKNIEALISYDINTSSLSQASRYLGGLEFSIRYSWSIIKKEKEFEEIVCPKYL